MFAINRVDETMFWLVVVLMMFGIGSIAKWRVMRDIRREDASQSENGKS
jgi:hypothetical protein